MTTAVVAQRLYGVISVADRKRLIQSLATAAALLVLYAQPFAGLVRDWWSEPDAGHGLLLAPIAAVLAWRAGIVPDSRGQRALGASLLILAVVLRYVGSLAAELFTMRVSLVLAILGLVVFYLGVRQIRHSWLPVALLVLSIPLPVVVLGSIALPLQITASKFGASLLAWRDVPILVDGNVIRLPGQDLFVTEACSGLRSLASLLALGVMIGGMWLRWPVARAILILLAIPVAIVLNGIRVFLTGFLVYYVDPKLGDGFMHLTEGWIIFVVAFAILGAFAWLLVRAEDFWRQRKLDEA